MLHACVNTATLTIISVKAPNAAPLATFPNRTFLTSTPSHREDARQRHLSTADPTSRVCCEKHPGTAWKCVASRSCVTSPAEEVRRVQRGLVHHHGHALGLHAGARELVHALEHLVGRVASCACGWSPRWPREVLRHVAAVPQQLQGALGQAVAAIDVSRIGKKYPRSLLASEARGVSRVLMCHRTSQPQTRA